MQWRAGNVWSAFRGRMQGTPVGLGVHEPALRRQRVAAVALRHDERGAAHRARKVQNSRHQGVAHGPAALVVGVEV